MSLNHPCPLLRNIYDMLLDEWYEDQHFDSPVLDQLRQIERECGATDSNMKRAEFSTDLTTKQYSNN